MEKRILITGANGFAGKSIVQKLISSGFNVSALIMPGTSDAGLEGAAVYRLPLICSTELISLLEKQNFVVNLAGVMAGANPERYYQGNVATVKEILQSLLKTKTPPYLIHVSSVAAIGPAPDGVLHDENAMCYPVGLYGKTKKAGENILLKHTGKLPFVIIRPPSLYGPEDRCFLDLFRWAAKGYFPRLITRKKLFQILFISDFSEIIRMLICNPPSEIVLNVGAPHVYSDEDMRRALELASGNSLIPVFFPASVVKIVAGINAFLDAGFNIPLLLSFSKVKEMSHENWLQDFSKFMRKSDKYKFISLNEGIVQTWKWYKDNLWIS
ncbi:MAG: NAD(P)-dependent oxidoreductase [Candidatus Riflebacteria bacterium]|nr:NAD(P)-dependent oxidoreductase [Candidatus Riflebacteria bacterium]